MGWGGGWKKHGMGCTGGAFDGVTNAGIRASVDPSGPPETVHRPGANLRASIAITVSVQSGGAAAPHLRPGFRSLRSPAAAGATGGPWGRANGPSFPPQAAARAAPRPVEEQPPSRAPAPRTLGRRGSAAFKRTAVHSNADTLAPVAGEQPTLSHGSVSQARRARRRRMNHRDTEDTEARPTSRAAPRNSRCAGVGIKNNFFNARLRRPV